MNLVMMTIMKTETGSTNYDLGNIEDDNDNQTSEYTSYGKPSKYDPQYSQDPFERYDHGGSQSGH